MSGRCTELVGHYLYPLSIKFCASTKLKLAHKMNFVGSQASLLLQIRQMAQDHFGGAILRCDTLLLFRSVQIVLLFPRF